MYLWCSLCLHAYPQSRWSVPGQKYGVCPKCGASEYRNAAPWEPIAVANAYPIVPDPAQPYDYQPSLF